MVSFQIREGASKPPPAKKQKMFEIKGKRKAPLVVELEYDSDSSSAEIEIPPSKGDGEPGAQV